MLRIACLAVFALLSVACASAQEVTGALPRAAATLKREVTITRDIVRIGDLIDNAGPLAETPIFRSPDVGETGNLAAYRVVDAVRPFNLKIDTQDIAEVAVTRAGHVIPAKEITATISRTLAGRFGLGDVKNLTLTFDAEPRPVHVGPSMPTELEAMQVAYNPRSGRFDVTLAVAGTSARDLTFRFAGSVVESREAAVLVHSVARGEILRQSDIIVERRSKADVGDGAFDMATDVVGLAARHALSAGQMLRNADVMKPEIVRQNEPVTLIYEAPGIMLTVRGKAVTSGSEGDVVSVINLQANRTIQGTVIAAGQVRVSSGETRIVATAAPPAGADAGAVVKRVKE